MSKHPKNMTLQEFRKALDSRAWLTPEQKKAEAEAKEQRRRLAVLKSHNLITETEYADEIKKTFSR